MKTSRKVTQSVRSLGVGVLAFLLLGIAADAFAASAIRKNSHGFKHERIAIEKSTDTESVSRESQAVKEEKKSRRSSSSRMVNPSRR